MLASIKIEYHDGDTLLEGHCVYPANTNENTPAVLVVHDWSGINAFAIQKAEHLATLGYIGFALDMYGKGKVGKTKEEKAALMQPFMQDRFALQHRILAAFNTVKQLKSVDAANMGAIGFCFGGLCALDLARSGADVKAVVSFHGLLNPPANAVAHPIKAKILALHGYDDPMVTHEQVLAFANEMTLAQANWQIDMYGHTMHAFTNPEANDPDFGTVYQPQSDTRAWRAMTDFFKEAFGK